MTSQMLQIQVRIRSDLCKKCSAFNDLTAVISVETSRGDNCSAGPPTGCCLELKAKFKIM